MERQKRTRKDTVRHDIDDPVHPVQEGDVQGKMPLQRRRKERGKKAKGPSSPQPDNRFRGAFRMLDADVHEGRGYDLYRYADEGSQGIFRFLRNNDKGKHDDGRNSIRARSIGVVLDLELTKVHYSN